MLAESLAVIGDDDDRTVAERSHETSELLVHRRDFAEVWILRETCAIRLGRRVGIVRFVVVDPQKQRTILLALQERDRAVRRLARRPLRESGRRVVVVEVEAARETETPRQRERGDECRGAIAGGVQSLRDQRARFLETARVLVHAVSRRIQAGHHRGVRRQRLRHRRIRLAEQEPLLRERVERRRRVADRVRARGVEGDEEDGGTCGRGCGCRCD